jgi:hypothetical protein
MSMPHVRNPNTPNTSALAMSTKQRERLSGRLGESTNSCWGSFLYSKVFHPLTGNGLTMFNRCKLVKVG